ncbi:glycosyl transferase [Actinomycetota bacterium]|nr:glycosyl transferase [Actinomycetota bacterium]
MGLLFERLVGLTKDPKAKNYKFEFLFVDDGSKDQTVPLLREFAKTSKNQYQVRALSLSRNFGKELAMAAALDECKGDAALFIDADLQDPPELIWEMLEFWEQGYDDIYAKRRSRKGESVLKKWTSQMYYKVLKTLASVEIQVDTGDFRLLDRKCVDALKSIREQERNTKALFSWIGYNKKEILYDRDPRAAGKTKWNYFKLLGLAINGITSYTIAPLRIATALGLVFSAFAFIYLVWILVKTFAWGTDLGGYPSTMAAILFFGGVQLLSLGIIGEYIGKSFMEDKRRPLYLVKEDISS